VKLKGPTTVAS